jgi:1-deoxy-D-xylulose-5-phosphate reductoisomerase
MTDEAAASDLRARVADTDTKVLAGFEGITEMLHTVKTDNPLGITAENSILGEAGLLPTLETLKAGHKLALANKESLVVGGELVMSLAREKGTTILPVDSEHCAIFQCLRAGHHDEISRILLTASGGPFYGYTKEQLQTVTKAMTLAHPTWKMGAKITVDSATLMNKGFEVIEAAYLFDIPADRIDVVVHRESIIHSMVEYIDGSVMAQMSVPDMRHCIQHALTHPHRETGHIAPLDLVKLGKLTFAAPDEETFVLLPLAREAMRRGGAVPAVLNAANEVAVDAFLHGRIGFTALFDTVVRTVEALPDAKSAHALEDILEFDRLARMTAESYL